VGLTNVWVQTRSDGLVRADQIVGIDAHQTPALSGKPARWLLDVVLPASIGSSAGRDCGTGPAARPARPRQHGRRDHGRPWGIRREERTDAPTPAAAGDDLVAGSGRVRFRFVSFASPAPGRHTGAEYL